MLEARGLTKCYATLPAVNGVSFSIRPGEILGYLGPNGSGKSTTVKMLTGLLDPTRGEVLLHGRSIRDDLIGYKKRLGYVPEEALLYPYLTGWEYLEFVGTLRGMEEARLRRKIDALLQLLMLYPHHHASISSYSKGMRQRILLIAALMDDPEILVNALPPVWFLGLSRSLTGRNGPEFMPYAALALRSLMFVCVAALVFYSISYRRHFALVPEAVEKGMRERPWGAGLRLKRWRRLFLRTPFERAFYPFIMKTLARSEKHSLFFGAFTGLRSQWILGWTPGLLMLPPMVFFMRKVLARLREQNAYQSQLVFEDQPRPALELLNLSGN